MAASGLGWTLGARWQHNSQGLSGAATQISCWYAYRPISQSSHSINGGLTRAHWALQHGSRLQTRISHSV